MAKGKNRKRRNRNRNNQNPYLRHARFVEHTHVSHLQDVFEYEAKKKQQTDFLKKVGVIEADILSRTVVCSNVKDLRQYENMSRLQRFMELQFGTVESCQKVVTSGNRRRGNSSPNFPRARIRFARKQDAEAIFGGTPLKDAQRVDVSSPEAGYRGSIRVEPTQRYDNMLESETKGHAVTIGVSRLAYGHFVPSYDDMYDTFLVDDDGDSDKNKSEMKSDRKLRNGVPVPVEDWIEEGEFPSVSFTMSMNLRTRTVEISRRRPYNKNAFLLDSLFSGLNGEILNQSDVLSFRFKDLQSHIDLCRDEGNGQYCFIISLKIPPRLYLETVQLDRETREEITTRERAVEFGNIPSETWGRCLSFKAVVDDAALSKMLLYQGSNELQEFGVLRRGLNNTHDAIPMRTISASQPPSTTCMRQLEEDMERVHNLHPELGITVRALLDSGRCSPFHLAQDTTQWTKYYPATLVSLLLLYVRYERADVAIKTLESISNHPKCTNSPCKLFCHLVDPPAEAESVDEAPIPLYCMRIPRLLITPCQIKVTTIGVEMSNRVVRKFVTDEAFQPTSFLRAQIADEDASKIFGFDLNDKLSTRTKNIILSGIKINGRHYQFLAYSSSQLKECSIWMVCPEKGWTIRRMRRSLGNFSTCKTASKYAARIGQCFSTTVATTIASNPTQIGWSAFGIARSGLDDNLLRKGEIGDIKADGDKVHTDGTGIISRKALDDLLGGVPFAPSDPSQVSTIQIRFGGSKGTLTGWDLDMLRKHRPQSAPKRFNVLLRPSMIKFQAAYDNIEVCSIAKTIPYYLNRNVILLLRVHGVRSDTFLDMQREMLDSLDRMLEDGETAWNMIPRLSGPDSTNRATLQYILSGGLSPSSEPFVLSCLHAVRSHHLYSLRKKARILVEKGAVMMGGIDETGLVPEGCVFLQCTKGDETDVRSEKRYFEIIVGPVMVTKHPVMHPGDVRMLLAIDIPELRNHKNVLLFSQHGHRPEADKMSGSDLDGDEFAVTWDRRLFLNEWNCCSDNKFQSAAVADLERANYEPLDYNAPPTDKVPLLPEDEDDLSDALIEHFLNHLKNDNLGRIAMLWLDYAEIREQADHRPSADCSECIELSKLYSVAVDFPKSGVPAILPKQLVLRKAVARPHWRELNDSYLSFHSRSVIGRLYDDVTSRDKSQNNKKLRKGMAGRKTDKYGSILSTVDKNHAARNEIGEAYDARVASRLKNAALVCGLDVAATKFDSSSELQQLANDNRIRFEEEVVTLMNKYMIRTEGELFTGCIRKYHKLHKKRQHDIAEEVRRRARDIRAENRKVFFRSVVELAKATADRVGDADTAIDRQVGVVSDAVKGLQLEAPETVQDAMASKSLYVDEDDGDDEDVEDIECTDQELKDAEKAATGPASGTETWESRLRSIAFLLAAAYYMSSYSPDHRVKHLLFGFPWIVADVIATGLADEQRLRNS